MSDAPDPFEFLKAFWNPLGLPMASMVTPTLDVSEVEKRIADLKLVENWLNMNLSMLRMSIQALEMQKMTLAAMQGVPLQGSAPGGPSALDAWLKMMQSMTAAGSAAGSAGGSGGPGSSEAGKPAGGNAPPSNPSKPK
jgi:hypothetical protein